MANSHGYVAVRGSEHKRPRTHKQLHRSRPDEQVTVTLILRRRRSGKRVAEIADFDPEKSRNRVTRAQFTRAHGADPKDLRRVEIFARSRGLQIIASHPARRSVVVRGPVMAMNKAFEVDLHDYKAPNEKYHYRGHPGPANVPSALGKVVEAVIGLTNRPVPAIHYARVRNSLDPPHTGALTPQQIAELYEFPAGDGAGETIGIYEMITNDGPPGYSLQNLRQTMRGFGGHLPAPTPIDVAIDGVGNSGNSDGETVLDITVAAAIAPRAKIVVYFTGETPQSIIHALQRMIHPDPGDPEPSIISISYGWGADGGGTDFTEQEFAQLGKLFQDAASLSITVLVSSGDSGAFIPGELPIYKPQTSYPATEPWVIACGGTTVGNIRGASFDEYAWNDLSNDPRHNPGATGGGVSARFAEPGYQQNANVPKNITTGKAGRGIPDIAGNASENSGYNLYIGSRHGAVGGTSAVAPLYSGLFARINANLGAPVGFINPILYRLAGAAFRDIVSPPGPDNNDFGRVVGYPVRVGWDACTGLGSVKGIALQNGLKAAGAGGGRPARESVALGKVGVGFAHVFKSGPFRGVDVTDAFALAAQKETPITVPVATIDWPRNLKPKPAAVGHHRAGEKITDALDWHPDVLIVLYTNYETSALLEAFTGDKIWTAARKKKWCGYAHRFEKFKPMISGIWDDTALKQGMFGYLSAMKIGDKTVALYKSELHPKQNGDQLPFVPVMQQLIAELAPKLVISTGTAGAIGSVLNCGDVAITTAARFHCEHKYPNDPAIDKMSSEDTELTNEVALGGQYLNHAASKLTKLSLPGLAKCYDKLRTAPGYNFVQKNTAAPKIYITGKKPVPGPEPMVIVSADYLSVADKSDKERLQKQGIMNDTDDAFLFYAISKMTSAKPHWVSIRNASEPQIVAGSHPSIKRIKSLAGRIYGIYQYCTTINSALACWGVVADLH